jgi:C4-dicarboxylate transporter
VAVFSFLDFLFESADDFSDVLLYIVASSFFISSGSHPGFSLAYVEFLKGRGNIMH